MTCSVLLEDGLGHSSIIIAAVVVVAAAAAVVIAPLIHSARPIIWFCLIKAACLVPLDAVEMAIESIISAYLFMYLLHYLIIRLKEGNATDE